MKAPEDSAADAQWTRNRVWQYPHVATPKRSTFCGGAPQFGHGISIDPRGACGPAGGGDWTAGGAGTGRSWPESIIAITPPPDAMRMNPRPATRTGWTIPVTAAARVPNMNTKNPAKMRAKPATDPALNRGGAGRTYGVGGGWKACATGERARPGLDEACGAVRTSDSNRDSTRQAISNLTDIPPPLGGSDRAS